MKSKAQKQSSTNFRQSRTISGNISDIPSNEPFQKCNFLKTPNYRVILWKGIQIYQRGRQKSLSRKTHKTMTNKMKGKTNIELTQ